MGKKKSWKQNTDQIANQQLHGTISGSVKKNKEPKFKKTPIGKVALINSSKIQKKEVKSEKNAQKSYVDGENKNQDLPKKAFKDGVKQSSSNGKQSLSSKNESFKGKYICNPEETSEHIYDSDSHISEEISQEDSTLNKTDESIEEEEDSDSDIVDILGKSLKDESDEDDEDYENLEEEDNEDDEDNDEEGRFKHKGVKMFRGLRSDAKKDESNEENRKFVQTGINLDNSESSSSDDSMDFIESDDDDDYENQVQNNKNARKTDTSMEIDKVDDNDEDDDDDDDDTEVDGDEDDNDDDDDDEDDDDSTDEEMGLKALLGKNIADDDDDKDFNEEDEDDEDDDISSDDEDNEENNTVKQMKDYDNDEDFNEEDYVYSTEDEYDEDYIDSTEDEYDEENNTVEQIKGKEKRDEIANQIFMREFMRELKPLMTPEIQQRYKYELQRKVVIVQNISKDTTRDGMIELFRQFGGLKEMSLIPLTVIKTVKTTKKADDGTQHTYYETLHKLLSVEGRFLYATEKSAQDAEKALHGKMVDGHYLCVQTLAKFNEPYNPEKCVSITNLKMDVKLNDIWKAFLKYGDIICIKLIRNSKTKACKNGYVQFCTKEAVASVLNSRSTIKVKGQEVIVSKPFRTKELEKKVMITYKAKMKALKDRSVTEENERENFERKQEQINDKIAQKYAIPKAVFVHSKENVKKQQGENEEKKSTVFQGQKVHLKSKKKKKSKLDKKKKEMAKKLTAKSARV